jgi:hypothetical protein
VTAPADEGTVVELWKVPAEELLATEDPGLMPWVPLSQFDGAPEELIRRCRRIIDVRGSSKEHVNLLAVTQVFTRLRYNEPGLFALLGGRSPMIESPLIREVFAEELAEARAEAEAKGVLRFLRLKFGVVSPTLEERVLAVRDEETLERLSEAVLRTNSLQEFERHLPH